MCLLSSYVNVILHYSCYTNRAIVLHLSTTLATYEGAKDWIGYDARHELDTSKDGHVNDAED